MWSNFLSIFVHDFEELELEHVEKCCLRCDVKVV